MSSHSSTRPKITDSVDLEFVRRSFTSPAKVQHYRAATDEIGLWESECVVLEQHLPRSGSILDIGCGTGRVVIGLYRLGFRNLEGVDLSEPMVEAAKELAARHGIPAEFRVGNATRASTTGTVFLPGRCSRSTASCRSLRGSRGSPRSGKSGVC